MPCFSTRCPGRPPYVLFPLTAGLPLMGSCSCCASSPCGLWGTPVEQGLPWHPVATGLAGQAIPFVVATSHPLHSGSLFPLFWLPLLPCCAPPPCLLCSPLSLLVWLPRSVCLCCSTPCLLALLGAPFTHPLLSHPLAPPVPGFHISVQRGLSRARLASHGPVATPVAGTSRRTGRSSRPCGVRGHLVEGGGGVFADGSLGVPHLVVAAVLAPRGSLVYCCVSWWGSSHCRVWGGPVPSCFVACVPPNFGLFLFLLARSLLLVCGAGGGSMSLPPSPCGCRVVPLSVVWYQGHRALLHMSPNLQTDLSLVFVGVVLG